MRSSFRGLIVFERAASIAGRDFLYWSVTAYDRETHALIKNVPRASRSSQIPALQKMPMAQSMFFGSKAPTGKEANWVPTDPARKFELMARFYAPKKEFFDKVWKLPDVEKMQDNTGTVGRQ